MDRVESGHAFGVCVSGLSFSGRDQLHRPETSTTGTGELRRGTGLGSRLPEVGRMIALGDVQGGMWARVLSSEGREQEGMDGCTVSP